VRFLVRRGIVFQDFDVAARRLFVTAAVEELEKSTKKINASRISVVTGLQRREVIKHLEAPVKETLQTASLTARVLGQWENNPNFITKDKTPRVLKHEGDTSEFAELCASVSTAINAGTLLFELQRTGVAKLTPHGVKLLNTAAGSLHDVEKVHTLLSKDINLFICAAEENMERKHATANHYTRTEYDNIYVDKLEEARSWVLNEGRLFHRKIREYLAKFDQDTQPSKDPARRAGGRIAISSASLAIFPPEGSVSKDALAVGNRPKERLGKSRR
jgi:hypothetical protein